MFFIFWQTNKYEQHHDHSSRARNWFTDKVKEKIQGISSLSSTKPVVPASKYQYPSHARSSETSGHQPQSKYSNTSGYNRSPSHGRSGDISGPVTDVATPRINMDDIGSAFNTGANYLCKYVHKMCKACETIGSGSDKYD